MIVKHIDFFDPHKIALSGQAFRIDVIDETHVELVAFGKYLQIACLGNNNFAFSCDETTFDEVYVDYFDLGRDYCSIVNSINSDDTYLVAAAEFGYGIRILKQEKFETLISFIISQRRSIPAIKTSVERISERFGAKIEIPTLDDVFASPLKKDYYAFPSAEDMADATLDSISEMGVGYRAEYILYALRDILNCKIVLEDISKLPDDKLFEVLTSMRGVGTKVANCTMLFGFARTNSFPIDVWIQRILDKYYGGKFDTTPYVGTAGIMQQFMFFYERNKI